MFNSSLSFADKVFHPVAMCYITQMTLLHPNETKHIYIYIYQNCDWTFPYLYIYICEEVVFCTAITSIFITWLRMIIILSQTWPKYCLLTAFIYWMWGCLETLMKYKLSSWVMAATSNRKTSAVLSEQQLPESLDNLIWSDPRFS